MKFSKIALTTVAVAGLASTTSAHDAELTSMWE